MLRAVTRWPSVIMLFSEGAAESGPLHASLWAAMLGLRTRATALVLLAVATTTAGCRQEGILVNAPPPADTTGGGSGSVQRATLSVMVRVAPEDSRVAKSVGWAGSAVPGATVEIRLDTGIVATTNDSGVAQFERLLPGEYTVSVLRLLNTGEKGRLTAADQDVDAVAGGAFVTVSAPETGRDLLVNAGRRGSLVVSEFLRDTQTPGVFYPFGSYLELYNNSDTTIYLDGKLVGEGGVDVYYEGSIHPCAPYQSYRDDSLGLWTRMVYRFPGAGTDYPLAPGRAVVIATDAVDHRAVLSDLDDLSSADFEFIGPADADNPSVPNMINVGPSDWSLGHGLFFFSTFAEPYVADNVDVGSLPVSQPLNLRYKYLRIPRAAVLDLGVFLLDPSFDYGSPLCEPQVSPVFDRQYARVIPAGEGHVSVQRRVLRTLPDGRRILLRTKTSSRDFEARSPRTPGWVP